MTRKEVDNGLPAVFFGHGNPMNLIAFAPPHVAKARVEIFLVLRVGQLGDQRRVADGDPDARESLLVELGSPLTGYRAEKICLAQSTAE